MKRPDTRKLLRAAAKVRDRAYVPYSNYSVGAAVMGASGKVYAGCNVENASFGLTVCAERTAIFKGISEGEREFVAVAVVTENGVSPCGACRQVISEFMQPDAPVVLADARLVQVQSFSVDDLLPEAFTPGKLREGKVTSAGVRATPRRRALNSKAS